MSHLYDADILEWSEHQAALLRRVAAGHWRAEARGFRGDAASRLAPSMRQRLDMARIYGRALQRLPNSLDGFAPRPVPDVCPVTLDELLALP